MALNVKNQTLTSRSLRQHLNEKNKKKSMSFGNFSSVCTNLLIKSDKSPIIGVAIVDVLSCIGPRTAVDALRNGFAATETFLRESSGLIINCMASGFLVLGISKIISNMIIGPEFSKIKDLNAHKIWANEDSINAVSKAWIKTASKKDTAYKTIIKIFYNTEGLIGNEWKKFKELPKATRKEFYTEILKIIKSDKPETVDKAVNTLIQSFGASKNIRFAKKAGLPISCDNLNQLATHTVDLCKAFIKINDNTKIESFAKNLKKLVNYKSGLGLALTMFIGFGVQWINRQITKKRSGHDGFVGDPNYGKKTDAKKAPEANKTKFGFHKIIGAAAMAALALYSFDKKPSMKIFQFKSLFPSMDQCRLVSAATFIGRIFASEDENELRETTIRDMLGFAHLYLLGAFVAKGVAKYIERNPKFKGQLLNKDGEKYILKGFEEVSKFFKPARALAHASGLLYSTIILGVAVPLYNKWKTEKNAKEKMTQQSASKVPKNILINNEAKKIYASFIPK